MDIHYSELHQVSMITNFVIDMPIWSVLVNTNYCDLRGKIKGSAPTVNDILTCSSCDVLYCDS